jgi:nucleotide-binding universal stress UspA family protein
VAKAARGAENAIFIRDFRPWGPGVPNGTLAAMFSERLVVVGTDGSDGGRAALAWALAHAGRTGATVQVVTAYGPGARAAADAEQQRDVTDVLLTLDFPPVVAREVVPGDPVPVLAAASAGADMLVVGTQGRSRCRPAGTGSVAAGCAGVAPCPVLVVPTLPAVPRRREMVARARRL